ncbi:glycerophosphodiester phosphodiesterase family protein [Roseomonas harenae]|uniref:glycerophosphodiester phosphodiesterase family protein n=1 Tax=Muricoccus harenae TaxID=2692566 RepID=UPI0013315CDD|nr:glycerophosphodiester phosphodiesterase family protein [Roseomonas harenae]
MTLEIFGHRGTNPYADHSADAHAHAIDWGADWAEFDIQMTSDGVLVVAHDTGSIPTTTYAKLLASSPGTMTLDQALDLIAAKEAETGREIKISIEMKSPAAHAAKGLDMPQALVDLLVERGITSTDGISVSSFDTSATQRLANTLYPAAGISTSIDYVGYNFNSVNLDTVAEWADTISVNTPYISASLVAKAHAAGLKVYAWTHTGTGEELQGLIDMGVDGVYSDNTRVAREYVDSVEGFNTVYGGIAADVVSGTNGNDVVYGLQGNDTLLGGAGNDVLNGDGGNDVIVAGGDGSTLRGGGGNDVLFGGTGVDILAGGVGNDAIAAGDADTIRYTAGDGIDLVVAAAGSAVVVEDIASTKIAVGRLDGDLVVTFADGGALVFEDGAAGALPGNVTFDDGVSLTGAALAALASDTAPAGIAAAVGALEAARAAAEPARALPLAPNLIQNGSFENIDGTLVRDWGRYDADGLMPGWVNLATGRVEQHQDTVSGVKAVEGAYWTDLDGWQNNVQLAQTVEGVEKGATYQLSFQIADTDLTDAEKLTVTYGGVVVYSGAPKGAAWEKMSVRVVGGSGNGSDTLIFSQTGGKLNGAGLALDNVAMIKTAAAPAGAADGNLIFNGGFENINSTEYRDWGRYSPDGVMPGWDNLATGRVEQHRDTVSGVSAAKGQYWTDLDGWQNNVQLAQDVAGVQRGATYRLSFQVADTDLKDNEGLTVTYGGKIVYQGAPSGAAWETVSVEVLGGSGDGSDRLVFAQTGGKLDGAGLALDEVSMIKTADPNAPIQARADAVQVTAGLAETGLAAVVTANDTDADAGDVKILVSVDTNGTLGAVSFDAGTQALSYAASNPAFAALGAGATAVDSFGYTVTDGRGATSSAVVSVTVVGVNDAPVIAAPLHAAATEDGGAVSLLALEGATDIDAGTNLSVVLGKDPLPAGVSFDASTGLFGLDTSAAAFQGLRAGEMSLVTVAYGVTDGIATVGTSATWKVTGVNDGPLAANDAVGVLEDATSSNLWGTLLGNDSDADAGDTWSIVSVETAGLRGTVVLDTFMMTLTYSADADEFDLLAPGASLQESFVYTMADSAGATSTARVTVTVTGGANNAPIAGTNKAEAFTGNNGEDVIYGGNGNDSLTGLDGSDQIWGENGDDHILGGKGIDFLFGGRGNDVLEGGGSDDFLDGGQGNDRLTGGDGADLFVYSASVSAGTDIVTDFKVGVDYLRLDGITSFDVAEVDIDGSGSLDSIVSFAGGSVGLLGVSGVSDWNTLMG